jgi:WD40 repeat protein/beta-lactamase regulating signal transducer with metallopeptidase domain
MREILSSGVDFLNRFGQPFCDFAGTMLVQVTILVLVLLAIEFTMRNRVRAVVRYWLWLLVLVKLVLPVGLHTPASLAYWLPTARAQSADTAASRPSSATHASPTPQSADRPDELDQFGATTVQSRTEFAPLDRRNISDEATRPVRSAPTAQPALEIPQLQWRGVLFGLWIVGVASLLTLVARRALWVRRIVRQATNASSELHEQLRQCLFAMGMTTRQGSPMPTPSPLTGEGSPAVSLSNGGEGEGAQNETVPLVAVKMSDRLGSPAICGLWRPTILLPTGFPANLDRDQIRLVFVHELMHWRRRDLAVNCLQTLLQILYFYNPAVWLANLLIRRLREHAVDETVLVLASQPSRLPTGQDARTTTPERYAATLLDIAAAPLKSLEATLHLTGVVESRRALASRIRNILARPVPRTAKLGLRGFAAIALGGVLLLPMGRSDRPALANDEPMSKPNKSSTEKNRADSAESVQPTFAAEKGKDIDGDALPPGAISRLGSKRFRTGREPEALVYMADGATLAQITGGAWSGWLQHLDPKSGRLLREIQFSTGNATPRAAIASAANVFVSSHWAVDNANKATNFFDVFDLTSGEKKMEFTTPDRPIEHLALSPDGRTVAYGDNKVHLVDLATKKEIASREPAGRRVDSLAFSQDSSMLAIGVDGEAMIWRWKSDEKPLAITLPRDAARFSPSGVDAVAFSPDGGIVALGSNDAGPQGVMLFDPIDGRKLKSLAVPGVQRWYFRTVQFSPNGSLVAANIEDNSGNGVALWDVASGKLIHRLFGLFGDAYYLSFSPDNRQLAASSYWYRTMCVWDLASGKPLSDGPPTHDQPPNTIRFLPGDERLVTAGDDYTISVWNISDSRQERYMRHVRWPGTYDSAIRGMDVSPDGKHIVSSSFDDTVRVWETGTGREVYRLPSHGHYGGHREVRFTPDSKRFASWGNDMRVYVWDVATGKAVNEFLAHPAGLSVEPDGLGNPPFSGGMGGSEIGSACFSPDASVLYLALDGVRRFSVASGKELPRIDVAADKWNGGWVAVSPDNRYLIWNRNGKPEKITLPDGSSRNVWKSHPVELRSLPDGNAVTKLQLPGEWSDCIAFSPDSRTVAMAIIDDPFRIELRRIPDLSEVTRIDLPSRAHAVEFSHSGKLLAVSLFDSTVLVWDLDHLPPPKKQKSVKD